MTINTLDNIDVDSFIDAMIKGHDKTEYRWGSVLILAVLVIFLIMALRPVTFY